MSQTTMVWRERIERQQTSGLPISRFCEREGISTASFFVWRKRLATQAIPMFLPVHMSPALERNAAIELEMSTGVVVRIFDGAHRQTLVDALEALAGASA